MKHPALTRVLAIVLAILCLTMGMAGWLGLRRAERDRQSALDEAERLRGRVEEYQTLLTRLEGNKSYNKQTEKIDKKQAAHDKDSAEHRTELSTYTLTQYGLKMGTDALDMADEQFAYYKAMAEEALAKFDGGMAQISELLGYLWEIYNTGSGILNRVNAHWGAANDFVGLLDSGAPLTYGQVAAMLDEVLLAADETAGLADTVRQLTPTLDALAEFDLAGLISFVESLDDMSPEMLNMLGSLDTGAGTSAAELPTDLDLPFTTDELLEMQQQYKEAWTLVKLLLARMDEEVPLIDDQIQQATGMSLADIRAAAQEARNALAYQGDVPLDEEQNERVRSTYAASSESIHAFLAESGAKLREVNETMESAGTMLGTVQTQMDAVEGMLASVRKALADGANALYEARALIWWQMGQQREKEEELRRQKEALGKSSVELKDMKRSAEDRKSLEDRQRSLRAQILDREEIRQRYDAGEEADTAALNWAEERESGAEENYRQRRQACLLMLAGALCGLIGIPPAFEQIRSRFMLLVPVLGCVACAAGAEYLFVTMGRGSSYSALAAAGFGLVQLLISLPKARKAR